MTLLPPPPLRPAPFPRLPPRSGQDGAWRLGSGGDTGESTLRGFLEQRVRQLQHQVRVKEERIVELETENAVLHLKLAEKLQQDVKEFRAASLVLLRDYQDQCQDRLSDIVAAVQRAQLGSEALRACRSEAVHLRQSLRELDARFRREQRQRRALHDSLVELRGNIRVHCRIRPLLPFDGDADDPVSQKSSGSPGVAHAADEETVVVRCHRPGCPPINKTYNFERVYGPAESQTAVFGDVHPLLTSLLDGHDVCVMAYGRTGSGKSYTMMGPHHEAGPGLLAGARGELGIIPRAAEELFRLISENPSRSTKVDVSVVEIYNNDIVDLLAKDDSMPASGAKREVVTTQEGWTEVVPLTREAVTSAAEFLGLVRGGLRLRARHPTLVHADSSRSHLVVTATLIVATAPGSTDPRSSQSPVPGQAGAGRRRSARGRASPPRGCTAQVWARLQLVDLAGSECAGVSGVTGLALRETSFINRSLAALADVLGALSERRSHIPYRNSKLTHLLQDAIGGDAKLLLILCVSPGQKHVTETLQALEFGARARQVERGQAGKRLSGLWAKEVPCRGSAHR